MTHATKVGARNSSGDGKRLQQIHDLAVENGAACPLPAPAKAAAIKGLSDAPGLRGCGARACWNCRHFERVEGDYEHGQCTQFDFQAQDYWTCDAWAPVPAEPLQVLVMNETARLSADKAIEIPAYV